MADGLNYGPLAKAIYSNDPKKTQEILKYYISEFKRRKKLILSDSNMGSSESDGSIVVGDLDFIKQEIFPKSKSKKLLKDYQKSIIVHEILEQELPGYNADYFKYVPYGKYITPLLGAGVGSIAGMILKSITNPTNKYLKLLHKTLPLGPAIVGAKVGNTYSKSILPYISKFVGYPLSNWGTHIAPDVIALEGMYANNILKNDKVLKALQEARRTDKETSFFNSKGYSLGDKIPQDILHEAHVSGYPTQIKHREWFKNTFGF